MMVKRNFEGKLHLIISEYKHFLPGSTRKDATQKHGDTLWSAIGGCYQ
jgi:hypothetical protein